MRPDPQAFPLHRGWLSPAIANSVWDALRKCFTYGAGDDRATGYLYSRGEHPWPVPFAELGPRLLTKLGGLYPIVAFQAYLDGSGCDWHRDEPFDAQAILSLGVTRTFGLKPLDGKPTYQRLNHGDLLELPSGTQKNWQHCVPVEAAPGERCSIVFRTAVK